ncbi:DNA polymerase I [Paraliomyxa miuraensis]|uniref:DNA polymerase I n=1 Tax=Paraliomyxa miuraensis TaxID=376150 RepID=UPI00224F7678|nr:DNA polymerase I [Paraliomyxa miuraensis]MCX4245700.1 DNA polymerase I [Paraliomyxa miuraensis]
MTDPATLPSTPTTPPSTPTTPPGGPGSLFLFDAYNFVFRAYHALPMLNAPDGTPVNAVHGFVRMVQATRRDFQPELVAAVFDAGGDGGRRALLPAYKANRPPAPEELRPQFPLVRKAVDALSIPRIEDPGFEADDVIASYARAAQAAGMRVIIVSSDKDLMQLCDAGVAGDPSEGGRPPIYLYDTMKGKLVGPAEVVEKFGVPPALLGDLLALTGDSSDNVPGVPGIGPKTAAELLHEHGSLEGVLAAAPSIKQKKRRERLVDHAQDARTSRQLVALQEVPLPTPLEALADRTPDDAALQAFFEPLGFKMVLRELGSAGRAARARSIGDDEEIGVVELQMVSGFCPAGDAHRLLLAADDAAFAAYVAALASAEAVAVHLSLSSKDPLEAEIVGVALAAQGLEGELARPVYVPLAHGQGLMDGKQREREPVLAALRPVLEAESPPKFAHDHKRFALALRRAGIELRGVTLDPMLASYVLDPARSAHTLESLAKDVLGHPLRPADKVLGKGRKAVALRDLTFVPAASWQCEKVDVVRTLGVDLQRQLSDAGKALRKLHDEVELPLARVLLQLEERGVVLDPQVLQRQSAELAKQIAEIQARVDEEAEEHVNLDSPIQLQELLFEKRGLPKGRKTKTGYSTDANVLEELAMLDPIVKDILEYRSLTKLKGTYLDSFPKLINARTGRLHTSYNQAVAATGRISSTDPNLQNIPIRTAEGRKIRDAFVAPPGRMLVAIDYSQIELRVLAHLSGDPGLRSAFIDDVDVHRRTAAEVFDVPEGEVTSEQRRIAKAVNFGVIYGQTAFGLAQQLGIPRGKAGSYIRAYFEKIPGVDRYMSELIARAKARGYAETILGRKRRIPELSRKGPARAYGERIARNTPIQGSAADILKVAMIKVENALCSVPWAQMLLTVHDELIFECDEARVDELVALCRPLMEGAVKLDVPLRVDAGQGRTWGECKG